MPDERPCFVCQTLDGDDSPKAVKYCPACGKDICDGCRYNKRRIKAAGIYWGGKVVKAATTLGSMFRAMEN